jgi:hypothetical protein
MDAERSAEAPPPAELDFDAFQRAYGTIQALSPAEAADLFRGAPFRWWIAGGWSVELGLEAHRFHEDLEVAIARDEVPAVRGWLRDYHLWDTHGGALRYLSPDSTLPIDHDQLWCGATPHLRGFWT